MELLIGFWILCGVAAGIALANKGRSGCGGFLLGLLLGPIGLVIALVMRRDESALDAEQIRAGKARQCPACAEVVKAEAKVCKHCGADLPPPDPEEIEIRQKAALMEKLYLGAIILVLVVAFALAGGS